MAFALFPAVSNAEDSSGIQYSDAPPTATGKTSREDAANSSNVGRGTDGPGQSSTPSGSNADGKPGDGSRGDEGGAVQGGGKGGSGGGQSKSQGNERGGQDSGALGVAPAATEDGGGSPLVPILIALAVLAAISIGAVAMRRKHQADPGPPITPEAG